MSFENPVPAMESEEARRAREANERSEAARAAEEKRIADILKIGDWEPAHGMLIGESRHQLGGGLEGTDVIERDDSHEQRLPGTWNRNNDVIVLYGYDRNMWIAPASEELQSALWQSGLQKDERLSVPMSRGDQVPVHPGTRQRWSEAMKRAAESDRRAREKRTEER